MHDGLAWLRNCACLLFALHTGVLSKQSVLIPVPLPGSTAACDPECWDYGDVFGPSTWPERYPLCGGMRTSAIRAITSNLASVRAHTQTAAFARAYTARDALHLLHVLWSALQVPRSRRSISYGAQSTGAR
jgi:hypothetical protein